MCSKNKYYIKYLTVIFLFYSNIVFSACLKSSEIEILFPEIKEAHWTPVGSDSILFVGIEKRKIRSSSLVVSKLPTPFLESQLLEVSFKKEWLKEQNNRFIDKKFTNINISDLKNKKFGNQKVLSITYSYFNVDGNKISGMNGFIFRENKSFFKFDFRVEHYSYSSDVKWMSKILEKIKWSCI